MRLSLLAILSVLALSGCNTYMQGTYEKVLVRTPGVDNAECDLYTDDNRYRVISSRVVNVERTKQPLTIVCRKTGYYPASVIVKPELAGPGLPLNLTNGVIPGTAYDLATGSIYDYPDVITVVLLPMPPQQLPPEAAPYEIQLKQQPVKPAPVSTAPPASAADKSLSKSGRK